MIVQVIGRQVLDFSTKEGQAVKGVKLFVAYPEENTEGLRTDGIFVREGIAIPKEMKINDKLDISYNNRGRIENIILK